MQVSIHASVKDATLWDDDVNGVHYVSIHASVKDATTSAGFTLPTSCFNPRVREGRDSSLLGCSVQLSVSIHASVKDATCYIVAVSTIIRVSIHASVKDATLKPVIVVVSSCMFQSTRP